MVSVEDNMKALAQHAVADPDFMERLRTDPDAALREAGVTLSQEDRASLTAASGSLGEALQARISHWVHL